MEYLKIYKKRSKTDSLLELQKDFKESNGNKRAIIRKNILLACSVFIICLSYHEQACLLIRLHFERYFCH